MLEIMNAAKNDTSRNRTLTIALWAAGIIITLLFALTGVIYANLDKRIDSKASIDAVSAIKDDVKDIKRGVWILQWMHMKQGYQMPPKEAEGE